MQPFHEDLVEIALDTFLKLKVDFADVRFVELKGLRIEIADGRVKELNSISERGLALRCLVTGGWGFTSTSLLTPSEVEKSCLRAYKLARSISERTRERAVEISCAPVRSIFMINPLKPLHDMGVEEKLKMCTDMEVEMKSLSDRIKSTNVTYSEINEETYVVNTLGSKSKQSVPAIIIAAVAYASEAGIVQRGRESHGGTGGIEILKSRNPLELAREAAREALELLAAKSPPAGRYPCILDPEIAGVFIHEAFGHACEADIVLLGGSILEGMLGRRVGSPVVTVKDDPSIRGLFGYTPLDSEGVSGNGTTIVENGVLKSFLHNLETSSRMKVKQTGNARAQGYTHIPLVRMTNTFIDKGDWNVEELFEDLKRGIYAKGSNYGYVDPAKGEFVFKCSKLYLVENGKPKQLCRDAALSGYTLDVLMNVDAVASDLTFKPGFCGKEDQLVRVTTGAPHVKVKDILVGGMA